MQNEMNQIDRMPKKNPLSFQIDLSKFEKATDEEKKVSVKPCAPMQTSKNMRECS